MSIRSTTRLSLLICFLSAASFGSGCAAKQAPNESSSLIARSTEDRVAEIAQQADAVVVSELALEAPSSEEPAAEESTPRISTDDPDRDRLEEAIKVAAEGDVERAERLFVTLQDHEKLGPYARYNLGVLAYARGEREQARRQFHEALRLQAGFGPATVALVRESLAAGQVAEARQFVEAQRSASDNASGVRAAALFLKLHAGDNHGVIADTRSVMIDEPTNLDAHYALAMANLALGRVELADYILNQALRRDAQRADIHYGLGRVALQRGRDVDARRHLEAALDLNSFYPEANVDLSTLQLQKLEYAQVVAGLEPVVRALPEFVDAWLNLGSGLKGVGRAPEAKLAFLKVLELEPRNAAAAFNLGILYLDVAGFEELSHLARMEQALSWFSKYRELATTIEASDPVTGYEQFVRDEIQMQEDLARQAEEDAERARRRAEREAAAAEEKGEEGDDASEPGESGGDDAWDDWDDW